MASRHEMNRIALADDARHGIIRIRESDRARLEKHIFQRYPNREWGTFFRFGWRRTPWGVAASFVDGLWPQPGDLDRQTDLTTFRDVYSRRAFQAGARSEGLAIGVVHSHPVGFSTSPSPLDDDMDGYFARELSAFTGGTPYCSLILQKGKDGLTFSGRIHDRGEWLPVSFFLTLGRQVERLASELYPAVPPRFPPGHFSDNPATARLESLMGTLSAKRLRSAVVGVIGCSGTGSPAIGILARAGVGEFILVDPDRLSPSNLERLHGAYWRHLLLPELPYKVDLMRDMITEINPAARVTTFAGNILHENVIDELLRCDLILGCVDTYHGRAALSDLAQYYLLPSLDTGIAMAGRSGAVTEQVVDLTQFSPDLPCAFCRGRIDTAALAQELMTKEEQTARQAEAERAVARGDDPDQYWRRQVRQLHTVGYLATMAGSLAAGYAEGWLTGAFSMPHPSFQFDIGKERLGCVAPPQERLPACGCNGRLGWGDATRAYRNVAIPRHWAPRATLRARS